MTYEVVAPSSKQRGSLMYKYCVSIVSQSYATFAPRVCTKRQFALTYLAHP